MTKPILPIVLAPKPVKVGHGNKKSVLIIARRSVESTNAELFGAAVEELYQTGFLHGLCTEHAPKKCVCHKRPEQLSGGVYACSPGSLGWNGVAREIAALLPGIVIPSTSHTQHGLTWQNGGGGPHGSLIEPGRVLEVRSAQGVVRQLIPNAPERWTMGGLARQLFEYVGPAEDSRWHKHNCMNTGPDRMLKDITFGYQYVAPGIYEDAVYHDCAAYYFTMFAAMPSLRPIYTPEGILWPLAPDGEDRRWREVLCAVELHKPLRNTLAGVAMGSYKRIRAYAREGERAKLFTLPGSAGPRRTAGLLLVRTGYELTFDTSRQSNTIYSRIDGIMTLGPRFPAWEKYGFSVKIEHSGAAEICQLGSYKVGEYETKHYKNGLREYKPLHGVNDPPAVRYGNWIACR